MQQPPYQPLLPQQSKCSRRRLWLILSIIVSALVLFCVSCDSTPNTTAVSTPTSAISTQAAVRVVTITVAVPTATPPTLKPTIPPTPTPTPKPTPKLQPTQAPTPTPTQAHTGINGNPWGYDFSPGNLIYSPASAFCNYFPCVSTFWSATRGYVAECTNGSYTHSGGVSGACSRDGGVMRALYSH